jgi:ribosome maturation factor RimP
MAKQSVLAKIEEVAGRVAATDGIEIVEIELKGGGKNQFLRISIDKPEGVTHDDCEKVSREVGDILDADDLITAHYTLEVSSPGVERKLLKVKDFERFQGKKAKIALREPISGQRHFEGTIAGVENETISLSLAAGSEIQFPYAQVERANLKFEW